MMIYGCRLKYRTFKIAMVNNDSIDKNAYFVHNNYMNIPRLFIDKYKNVVWSEDFTPFREYLHGL